MKAPAGRQRLPKSKRERLHLLFSKRRAVKFTTLLDRFIAEGFDLAPLPFQLVDRCLSWDGRNRLGELAALTRLLDPGEAQLLLAIIAEAEQGAGALATLARDQDLPHRLRFAAIGWEITLAHQTDPPAEGAPLGDIVQFWDRSPPPLEIARGVADWQGLGHRHKLYDDAKATAYIHTHFGAAEAKLFAAAWHPALKSDLFRLFRLAAEGGIWVDADSRPQLLAPVFLEAAGGEGRVWVSARTRAANGGINNGVIAAPAGHPLIIGFLDQVLAGLAAERSRAIFWLAGPGALTHYLWQTPDAAPAVLTAGRLSLELFRQFDAPYKRSEANWRVYEKRRGIGNDADLARIMAEIDARPPRRPR